MTPPVSQIASGAPDPIKLGARKMGGNLGSVGTRETAHYETVRVRVGLLRELSATGQPLVPTHVSFPAAGRVAVTREVFRWVPAYWNH